MKKGAFLWSTLLISTFALAACKPNSACVEDCNERNGSNSAPPSTQVPNIPDPVDDFTPTFPVDPADPGTNPVTPDPATGICDAATKPSFNVTATTNPHKPGLIMLNFIIDSSHTWDSSVLKRFYVQYGDSVQPLTAREFVTGLGDIASSNTFVDVPFRLSEFLKIAPSNRAYYVSAVYTDPNDSSDTGCANTEEVLLSTVGNLNDLINEGQLPTHSPAALGYSLSTSKSGAVIAVGDPRHSGNGSVSSGAVTIYEHTATGWKNTLIKPSGLKKNYFFGTSVSLSDNGSVLAIGAPNAGGDDYLDLLGLGLGSLLGLDKFKIGEVYVFKRRGENDWVQAAYITPPDGLWRRYFGTIVDLSGDGKTLATAAPENISGLLSGLLGILTGLGGDGRVVVFTEAAASNVWSTKQTLTANSSITGNNFASSISLSGDGNHLAVGASGEYESGYQMGSTYVFSTTNAWSTVAKTRLTPQADVNKVLDRYGSSVSLNQDGSVLAVGAEEARSPGTSLNKRGRVYVHKKGPSWGVVADIQLTNLDNNDLFGYDLKLTDDGDMLLVGTPQEDGGSNGLDGDSSDNSRSNSGAAFLFWPSSSGNWTAGNSGSYIKAKQGNIDAHFGAAVSISGDGSTMVIGSPSDSPPKITIY